MSHYVQPLADLLQSAVWRLQLLDLNPLYVLPVTAVLLLCLLVYALGFKSTSPPPSLHSVSNKESNKKATSSKKRNEKGNKPAAKSAAAVTVAANDAAPKAKPKAVVKPMRQETKPKKPKELLASKNNKKSLNEPQVTEEDDQEPGDWVPVLSDKTKKKQKQESAVKALPVNDAELADEVPVVIPEAQVPPQLEEVAVFADVEVEAEEVLAEEQPMLVENWEAEDPIELKESQVRTKKKNKRTKESRSELLRQSSLTPAPILSDSSSASDTKVVKDKLTSEILATYDSVPTEKAAARKRKEKEKRDKRSKVRDSESQQVSIPAPVSVATSVKDAALPVAKKLDVGLETEVRAAAAQEPAEKATTSSDTADITDATGSEPSDGEFKVVRKRKARRE